MSDNLVRATAIYEEMLARLPSQFRDKPRIAAVLQAFANQLTANENDFWTILEGGYIDNATGHDLDVLGDIVGEKRQGLVDDEYRRYIRARIKTNRSDGQIEQLIQIAVLILGSVAIVYAREYPPASIVMWSDDVQVNALILWRNFLNRAKGDAVSLQFGYSKQPATSTIKMGAFYRGHVLLTTQRAGSFYSTVYGGGEEGGVFG